MLSGTLSPSRPDPCLVLLFVSPLFSLFGLFVDVVFFLSFLSLRRWGNPSPLRGFGVPFVFLHPAHALRLRPVLRARHLHHGHAPHLFLFFLSFFFSSSSSSLVFRFGCFFGFLSWWCWVSWWVFLFLVLVAVLSLLSVSDGTNAPLGGVGRLDISHPCRFTIIATVLGRGCGTAVPQDSLNTMSCRAVHTPPPPPPSSRMP